MNRNGQIAWSAQPVALRLVHRVRWAATSRVPAGRDKSIKSAAGAAKDDMPETGEPDLIPPSGTDFYKNLGKIDSSNGVMGEVTIDLSAQTPCICWKP